MNATVNAGQFQRVAKGPQVGAPPSLEQVPLDRLQVDPAYQRATDGTQSRRIINGMIKQWDWSLCQPLAVSRRLDGGLYVLDGQHRLEGARARGDIHYLPCVINAGLDLAGEARTFVKINTERQKLSDSDVFLGMLAAGDADAVAVQAIMEGTGWSLARTKNSAIWKPGQLICGAVLVRMLKMRGENAVRFALATLRAAYPETPVTVTATLLAALGEIFDGDQMAGLSTAALADAIGAVEPRKWRIRAAKRRERFTGESEQTALAQCMIAAAKGQGEAAYERPAAPTPSTGHPAIAARTGAAPALAVKTTRITLPPKSAFGTEGKGWCDQWLVRPVRAAPHPRSRRRLHQPLLQAAGPCVSAARILIACEFSGTVRRAFTAAGFDAWSCDLLPAEDGSNHHITGDVRDVLGEGWDLLIVAHPPCTRLCNSGVRWLTTPPPGRTHADLWRELDEGAALFSTLWNAPVPRVAVENPVMHSHAKRRITGYQPAAQSVQPWQYGDWETKRTCLWLRGLPSLVPTFGTIDAARAALNQTGQPIARVHRMPPGVGRAKERSRFFPGIAAAMAAQWGPLLAAQEAAAA